MIKDSGPKRESTFVNRAQRALGVWGLAPIKIPDQIKQVKSTEQAPTRRVYITRSLVQNNVLLR